MNIVIVRVSILTLMVIIDVLIDVIHTVIKIISRSVNDHFRIILGPPMPNKYLFQRRRTFLEMAHTNFVSSIRKTPCQPLVQTKNSKNMFFEHFVCLKCLKTYWKFRCPTTVLCFPFAFPSFVLFMILFIYILYFCIAFLKYILRVTQPN